MTLSYLCLALGIAVLLNLANRWARLAGQALAAIALFFNVWSIWLAVADGTMAAALAGGRAVAVAALGVLGVIGAGVLLALLISLPRQLRVTPPLGTGNNARRWGLYSRLLHWASAVLMLCALPMGLFVTVLPAGATRAAFLDGHIGVGLAVLALLPARLLWQAHSPGPASPTVPAGLMKGALYALLAALPLTGLALAGALALPVAGISLPAVVDRPLAAALHLWPALALALLLAGHAGAALAHRVDGQRTLMRMLR